MYILEKDATDNPPPVNTKGNNSKIWIDIGNGKEILSKKINENKEEDKASAEIVDLKKKSESIVAGDLVYFKGKWVKLEEVKEGKGIIKEGELSIGLDLKECEKEIPINILFCSLTSQSVYLYNLKGRKSLEKVCLKYCKRHSVKAKKGDWYYKGKLQELTATIESIQVKPNDKLICTILGYDIKTFKRFTKLDEGRGWYMSHSSADAVTFIPTKRMDIFGFGMYYTQQGPPTYTLNYQILINDEEKLKGTFECTKPGSDSLVKPIYFDANFTSLQVQPEDKIGIVVKYETYDDSSRLLVGTDGNNYDTIEGNVPGLFKMEDNGHSGNGTDVGAGQIPELYYALSD